MAKYHIGRSLWHKGYVFLHSYIQKYAMSCWSTHKCDTQVKGDSEKSATRKYAEAFQQEHDKQMEGFIKIEIEGGKELKPTIDDRSGESKLILNSLKDQ